MRFRGLEETGPSLEHHNTPRTRRLLVYTSVMACAFAAAVLAILPMQDGHAAIGDTPLEAPSWSAFLYNKSRGPNNGTCSGVLISENLILSAKHCQAGNLDSAVVGSNDINWSLGVDGESVPGPGSARAVRRRGATDDLVGIKGSEAYPNNEDIAVFVLDHSLPLTQEISLMRVDSNLTNTPVAVYGYGVQSLNPIKNDLLLHYVEGDSINCINPEKTTKYQYCLKSDSPTEGPCSGDSGGPLVNLSNELAAIYTGRQIRAGESANNCTDGVWIAVGVTSNAVQDWVKKMISNYEPKVDF